ncbi:tryptophan synthase beta subunit-like PLP-dependent enzyme [Jaminaea rosea]|uniref:Serine racemase n=1 Tax=Jaminaea rosea TaxID=1569628 RepID=A0A316UW29_9BASI|nr:tryptophan synthase beta subunit-like PLP-dependent enzyme [Jaminaea rosea]PWN27325.1 tryptophan synthase beta subunit-like PLP-dependent enzyme [Jaminaea rosea]
MDLVSIADIQAAAQRIGPHVVRTPLLTNGAIDDIVSQALSPPDAPRLKIRMAFKAEHLQVVGAFKSRGAANAIQLKLKESKESNSRFEPKRLCVLTHSSGNHGAALACQAKNAGVQALVVMPEDAPKVKKQNVASYGARIMYCKPTQDAREAMAAEARAQLEKEGLVVEFIPPYDDPAIIAGQGTMGKEMMEQAAGLETRAGCSHAAQAGQSSSGVNTAWPPRPPHDAPPFDIIIAPVGGGGMLSGVATAVKSMDPRVLVVGAEPAGADDAQRSFTTGILQPSVTPTRTICDGLLTSLSQRTLAHIEEHVDLIATAPDSAVVWALNVITDKTKQLVEPNAAIGLATLLDNEELQALVRRVAVLRANEDDRSVRIGVVWSGGNTTIQTLARYLSQ